MENFWLIRRLRAILLCCIIPKMLPASSLDAGTPVPAQTWPSRAGDTSAGNWTDVSEKSFLGLNTDNRSKTVVSLSSKPLYKRWNFRKSKWKKYMRITNMLARDLLSPDTTCVDEAYQNFYNTIIHAAKKTIPRGRRKNYRPCCVAKCEALYQAFLWAPQGEGSNTAVSALLVRLDKRRRKRWSEAVSAIDFTHSSRLAWNAINNLTGRTTQSYRSCPISANSIASQLVKNWTSKTNDREFTRLVLKAVSELWRIPTPAGKCISGDFSPEEFARSIQMLKPGKAPGPDSICP